MVATVLFAVIGAASTLLKSDVAEEKTYYKATHAFFYDQSFDGGEVIRSAFSNIEQVAVLTTVADVPNRVADKISSDKTGRELAERVIVNINNVTSTMEITAVSSSADEAVQLADTFAEQLVATLSEKDQKAYAQARDANIAQQNDLQNQINNLQAQLAASPTSEVLKGQVSALTNQYRVVYERFQLIASSAIPAPPLSTLEDAQATSIGQSEYDERLRRGGLGENVTHTGDSTSAPISSGPSGGSSFSSPVSRGLLGAFLGFLAGIGIALLADRLDRRVRSREDVETAYGLPVLAEVPKLTPGQQQSREILSHTQPMSRTAEAYRAVRSSLLFQRASSLPEGDFFEASPRADGTAGTDDEPLVVMVTSAAPREGKTTTSANLAAVFAEAGMSVLVVNCDFRRPTIHEHFSVSDEPRRIHDTAIPNVKIVTNVLADSVTNPAQVVAAQRQVIAAARSRFDVVILDTAPLLAANDALEVVSAADLVVLVTKADVSTTVSGQRAMELLHRVEAPLSGVVMVAVGDSGSTGGYYYYGYQTPKGGDAKAKAATNGASPDEAGAPEPHRNGTAAESELFPTTSSANVTWSDEPKPAS